MIKDCEKILGGTGPREGFSLILDGRILQAAPDVFLPEAVVATT
jgi:hypothetical protein